ncbi:hypothetical protein [Thalassospira mesophila]|uniref:hypothetical protein n=1 Tax=Thalassospira mesophila TaxID=1293891 RepID=UPI0011802F2B|nr:hypothetical protein [Thalassospira mesophila]
MLAAVGKMENVNDVSGDFLGGFRKFSTLYGVYFLADAGVLTGGKFGRILNCKMLHLCLLPLD